jgi:NitT/TauT family transport system ATP-binding protein
MIPPPLAVTAPLLRLERLEKRFPNGTLALREMSLDVGEHQFLSLLGPSGCGKSTALRMIAGLADPSDGSVQWPAFGTLPEVGFVFQEPTLMPWATVFDNVWLPLRLKGQNREEARPVIETALRTVGLQDFDGVLPRELSGGMKMRVSIARAMVTHPKVLLMDEPFAALDEITRFRLNDDTLALWQSHRFTAIFVTHSVYEAVYLSNRVVVMGARPGRVVEVIAIDEPYPRNDAFRSSERYAATCIRVSAALRRAGEGQGPGGAVGPGAAGDGR